MRLVFSHISADLIYLRAMCVCGSVTMTLPYASQATQRLRGLAILSTAESPVLPVSRYVWRVASQTGHGFYTVRKTPKGWACDCAAFEPRAAPCKHIWALRIWLKPLLYASIGQTERTEKTPVQQDWPAYDAAQQAEHRYFDRLLWSLLDDVPEPIRLPGVRGRRPVPLRTALLMAVKKVHVGESSRRAKGLMDVVYSTGSGILAAVPNYAVPSRLFNQPDTGGAILDLIRRSAKPLREIEDGGTVAVDSSGFCTTCMGAYCTETHDPGRRHRWVKAHVIIGVKTHVVLDVMITDESGADCPQFVGLLSSVRAAGFRPKAIVADKAYLSRENYTAAAEMGVTAYIPFKTNSVSGMRGSFVWSKMYHLFQSKREEFDRHYHARSNVETVFSAIRAKLGENLLSKNPLARFNELLAKILAYNIGVLVHEIFEHGIDPASVGLPPNRSMVERAEPTGLAPSRDQNPGAVTQFGQPN